MAQASTASSEDLAWYEQQITGVLVGAVIAALVALVVAWANQRHARNTRWDEVRKVVYTGFLSADLDLEDAKGAFVDALLKWLRTPVGPDRTEAGLAETAARNRLEGAHREMQHRKAEVMIFGSQPVRTAAETLIDRTRAAGNAYHELEKSHDSAALQSKVLELVAGYGAAKDARADATNDFTTLVRKELRTS